MNPTLCFCPACGHDLSAHARAGTETATSGAGLSQRFAGAAMVWRDAADGTEYVVVAPNVSALKRAVARLEGAVKR